MWINFFNGRLFGQLTLTMALGDFSLKNNGLISTPSINKNKILENDIFILFLLIVFGILSIKKKFLIFVFIFIFKY